MTVSNFFLSYGNLISITLIPIIIWVLGIKYQDRKSKKEAKLNLFLTLMAERRKGDVISEKWADSLNVIDVIFQDDKNVRSAWNEFYDSLHTQSLNYSNNAIYLLALLSEMANSLGYKDLKQTEIDRFYLPNYMIEQKNLKQQLMQEGIRVLKQTERLEEILEQSSDPA